MVRNVSFAELSLILEELKLMPTSFNLKENVCCHCEARSAVAI